MQQNLYLKKFAAEILFDAVAFFQCSRFYLYYWVLFNAANFIFIAEFYLMQQNFFNAADFDAAEFFNAAEFWCIRIFLMQQNFDAAEYILFYAAKCDKWESVFLLMSHCSVLHILVFTIWKNLNFF